MSKSKTMEQYFMKKSESKKDSEVEVEEEEKLSPIIQPIKRLVLGVLGGHKRDDYSVFQKEVLASMIVEMSDKLPELVLIGDDAKDTSGMIYMWCEKNDIPCRYVKSDWIANGKRAGIIRDNQIVKDGTAFLIFEGPKSTYLPKLAGRLKKKNYPVLTITPASKKNDK